MRQLQRYVARIGTRRCLGRRCWRRCGRARTQWAEERALQLPAHLRNNARLAEIGRHLAQKFNCKYRHQYTKHMNMHAKAIRATAVRCHPLCASGCVCDGINHSSPASIQSVSPCRRQSVKHKRCGINSLEFPLHFYSILHTCPGPKTRTLTPNQLSGVEFSINASTLKYLNLTDISSFKNIYE